LNTKGGVKNMTSNSIQAGPFDRAAADFFAPAKNDRPLTDAKERGRRQNAIDFARASVELEGFTLSAEVEAINQRYIDGELTGDEHIAAIRAAVLHG
jgi:hypothetical protein